MLGSAHPSRGLAAESGDGWQEQEPPDAGAPAAEEEEDAAPPGTGGRSRAARTSAGPCGRTSRPLSSASGVAGRLRCLQLSPHAIARFHACSTRTSSSARAAPLARPVLGLGALDLPTPRGRPPPVSPGGGSGRWKRRRPRRGGGRHVTLVATFHHSHQINNLSVPRPPPCRSSQPVRPQNPPVRNPQTSRSNRDEGELDPSTKSQRPKGAAGRSRGEGVANFLGTAKRGSPERERGTREQGAGGRLPAIVYTGCAPR